MPNAAQRLNAAIDASTPPSFGFILACAAAFCVSVAATIHFCRSMCCEMDMPGGWTMSMMWMRMLGQSWTVSAAGFMLMWLAMMVAMMMPSAMPTFLRGGRSFVKEERKNAGLGSLFMATGYFAVWLGAGAGIYVAGAAFAAGAMQWEGFSRAVPPLSGAALIIAGIMQFTPWKMTELLRCRNPMGCSASKRLCLAGWRSGLNQGVACVICCSGPMLALVAIGMMNVTAMLVVTAVITLERFVPRPVWIVWPSGAVAVVCGVVWIVRVYA